MSAMTGMMAIPETPGVEFELMRTALTAVYAALERASCRVEGADEPTGMRCDTRRDTEMDT